MVVSYHEEQPHRNPVEDHEQNGITSTTSFIDQEEQEEALIALVNHRCRQVKNLRDQLKKAEEKYRNSKSKLTIFKGKKNGRILDAGKTKHGSNALNRKNETPSKILHQSKARHFSPKTSQCIWLPDSAKALINYNAGANLTQRFPIELDNKATKRKYEIKEQKYSVSWIGTSSSAQSVNYMSSYVPSLHKKRMRSLALCPLNDQLFATSALDGVIRLWEVQPRGLGAIRARLLSTTDCASAEQKRWPEDIAWHPEGKSLFSVYSADSPDSQVSVTNFKDGERSGQVNFLQDKPHVKGAINSIVFLPWEYTSFVTAGTDHTVMLWSENDEKKWKSEPLHRNIHTSAVMGVAGVQHKKMVLSVGQDKRILGYNAHVGRKDFIHQVDSKCLSILPNPADFNLFMVQTGTREKQLRLFDIRLKQKEVHAFGWKQERRDTQSALVSQDWSPNGLYITSGSDDPLIHIFDIRYSGHEPSQSIKALQKRVFRAMWHHSRPLLISISSDSNIGFHEPV